MSQGPNELGPKWVRAQMSWGPNVLGPKWVGAQMSRGLNELGPKCVGAQMSRGPNVPGPKWVGAQMCWGPNESGAQMRIGPKCVPAISGMNVVWFDLIWIDLFLFIGYLFLHIWWSCLLKKFRWDSFRNTWWNQMVSELLYFLNFDLKSGKMWRHQVHKSCSR